MSRRSGSVGGGGGNPAPTRPLAPWSPAQLLWRLAQPRQGSFRLLCQTCSWLTFGQLV